MTTMGIDQSFTSTAVYINNGVDNPFTVLSSSKDDDIYTRALFIAIKVVALATMHNVTKINIEGLAFGGVGNATRDLAGLQMLIVVMLRQAGFNPSIIPPTTLKKQATTNGRASKEDMHAALPQHIKDQLCTTLKSKGLYDVVDAYWLAHHV